MPGLRLLPNDLTNGLMMALAAGSVKLVIANEFREDWRLGT